MRYRSICRLLSAILALLVGCGASGLAQEKPLTALANCKFIPTPWGDGDSFLVEAADGARHTVRLYGVDCLEWHVNDETDARRLRAQRRYFGISEAGGSPAASIELAKAFGRQAAGEVSAALDRPFTVHTAFADAMGDVREKFFLISQRFLSTGRGKSVASRVRVSRHACHFRDHQRKTPALALVPGCGEPCLRPFFPPNPFLPLSEANFCPSCATTTKSNSRAIDNPIASPHVSRTHFNQRAPFLRS